MGGRTRRVSIKFCSTGTHYKMTIKISDSDESRLHGGEIGTMSIVIKSHHGTETTEKMPISQQAM